MKVLLVRPKITNLFKYANLITSEPLELEYLYTEIIALGHTAMIFDGVFEKKGYAKVLEEFGPDMIAITGYITQENLMISYALEAKRVNPEVLTVVGGVHVQLNPERFKVTGIDCIFRSESMKAFGTLVDAFENDKSILEPINGLMYRYMDEWIENPLTPVEIDELPIPDRSYFHVHKKRYSYLDLNDVATIKTSFSCPHNCNFCYCTKLGCGIYNTRDLDLVIEELVGINADNLLIADDDFLADINRAEQFVKKIKEAGLKKKYICYARADAIAENPRLIKDMADIGFKYFIVGLEAINDMDLKSYDKMTTEDINRRCIENIHASSAEVIALMMISHRAAKEDFKALYRWAKKNKLIYTTVSIFTPIPGTSLYDSHKDQITCKNIERWDFLHLVLRPEKMNKVWFYFYFILLSYKLYRLGKKSGGFDFTRNSKKKKR